MGVGTSGAVVDDNTSNDGGGSATKVVAVVEEKEKKQKPKKTVRFWDDEETDLEESKSGSSSSADASSGFSSSETVVDDAVEASRDEDVSAAESVDAHVSEHARELREEEGEVRHTATIAGEGGRNKKTEKKEREKKESIRTDGVSDGYTSFLGLGLDVERLVGFPYI